MSALFWCALALAAPAGDADAIKELKAQERTLLDDLDDVLDGRRKLDHQLRALTHELDGLSALIKGQRDKLEADARAYTVATKEARARARAVERLLRGQGARFLLAADSFADGLRRAQLLQRVLRRDSSVLGRAMVVLADQRERVAALERNQEYANDMNENVAHLRLDVELKTRELAKALQDIRLQRSQEERSYYDLREIEAVMQREDEEEAVALADAFSLRKGSLPWPVAGSLTRGFGRDGDPRFGLPIARSGIRIGCAAGAEVSAVHAGIVRFVDVIDGYGKVVIVQHTDNYFSVYGGLGEASVARGRSVDAGWRVGSVSREQLGRGGAYFELRRRTTPEDPTEWLAPQ